MPGFILHIGKENLEFSPETRKKLVVEHSEGKGYQVERRVVNKFMNDRIFYDANDYLVVVEGIVLNNHELMSKYNAGSWLECVKVMYEKEGDSFFNAFRGSFSGALYDKENDKWLIYTNHIGDKQIFLSKVPDGYLFGSEIGFIVDCRKKNDLPISLDNTGTYMTLTYGFCIENKTLISEIEKLCPGHYYKIENGKLEDIQYHRFSNSPKDISKEEAIEGIEKLFTQAIKRAFEKDKEYGYKHIATLSGGLDSRMTVMVAHELGYTKQLNMTYCESGYLDFTIAQQIATDLHHDWLFKPLDGGDCIDLIDDVTKITYGSANFFGLAHGLSMEKLINYDEYGIFHTGQLGDVIIGSYLKKMRYGQQQKSGDGAYSYELIDRLNNYKFIYEYDDAEIFMMYNRGLCGISQGLLTFQENSESYSPFTDVDFFEFCYSIPIKLRFNHKIYFDWILAKHPNAAQYIWEKTGKKIQSFENVEPKYMTLFGNKVPHFTDKAFPNYLKGFILRRLGFSKKVQKIKTITLLSKSNMNPVDYWYATNPYIRQFMDGYWNENKKIIPNNVSFDMSHLYNDCVLYDKLQCLTVLSLIKLIA